MGKNAGTEDFKGRKFIVIELKNVCKTFGEQIIFKNMNMTINDGEFVAITGKSGCGKTTLINIIGALEDVDSGEVTVDGIDITQRKNKLTYLQKKIGFLFQNFALVDTKTVRENMELIYHKSRSDISVEKALEMVGMADKIDTPVYQLSGGEQQRVAMARLMVKQCEIILADEPTGALDMANTAQVMDIFKRINESGKTVIIVTHDLNVAKCCDRTIAISEDYL